MRGTFEVPVAERGRKFALKLAPSKTLTTAPAPPIAGRSPRRRRDGQTLAMGDHMPLHLGAMPMSVLCRV